MDMASKLFTFTFTHWLVNTLAHNCLHLRLQLQKYKWPSRIFQEETL